MPVSVQGIVEFVNISLNLVWQNYLDFFDFILFDSVAQNSYYFMFCIDYSMPQTETSKNLSDLKTSC